MGIKQDEMTFIVPLPLHEVGRRLSQAVQQLNPDDVADVAHDGGSLGAFDDRADIEIAVVGSNIFGMGGWALQAYVVEGDGMCHVQLIALGDDFMSTAMAGARNSVSLNASRKKRDQLASMVR